uniref:Ecto-NOX disulfide-thiol exchanger 2 n=1 Tax=Tetraodon nigroviridis TaxID=99883 RepID=H3DE77_TETNG
IIILGGVTVAFPFLPYQTEQRIKERAEGICNMSMDSNSMTIPMSDPNAWATAMNNLGMPPIGITGQQLMPDFDPNLGMMAGITPLNPLMPGGMVPAPVSQELSLIKEIIHCKSCTLFPPNPNLPPPATRDRPPGCKTVFVGGLPENATEQLIMEVFGQCGDITAIRKSKKNFCHIRFAEESTVDKAVFVSGSYRIRLGSSTDKKDTGRLHVDFAQARDDLYEWECRQRMLAREERHRRKMEEDRLRPPSPPPIVHYSEHECSQLGEKIKGWETVHSYITAVDFMTQQPLKDAQTVHERYSVAVTFNKGYRRITKVKSAPQIFLSKAKEAFQNKYTSLFYLLVFSFCISIFTAAFRPKSLVFFLTVQKHNLMYWSFPYKEIRNLHNEQLMGIRREEEMEMSDDDMEDTLDSKDSEDSGVLQSEALKEENDSLRCQLDAYRNEVELLKQEQGKNQPMRSEEDSTHSQQLSFLQQALQGMQKQLLKMREELKQREAELERSLDDKQQLKSQVQTLKEGLQNLKNTHRLQSHSHHFSQEAIASTTVPCSQEKERPPEKRLQSPVQSEREAVLVGIISTFLHVHPFGASIEYICSYLQRLDTKVT